MAIALDELGVGAGERVAIVSPNSGRFLTAFFGVSGFGRVLVPINYRLIADEVGLHRRALGGYGAARSTRTSPRPSPRWRSATRVRPRRPGRRRPVRPGRRGGASGPLGRPTRTPPARSTTPRAPRPAPRGSSSPTGTAGSTPPASAGTPPSPTATSSAHPADVPLQRLGYALRGDRHGRPATSSSARSTARRSSRGSTPRGLPSCAGPRRWWPPSSTPRRPGPSGGSRSPGRGPIRIVVAGAPPPSRTIERVEAELGWEFIQIYGLTETAPLLTINRAPQRVGRAGGRRAGTPAQPGRRPRRGGAGHHRRRGRGPGPLQPRLRRLLGASPTSRPRRSRTGGSAPATAGTSTGPTW